MGDFQKVGGKRKKKHRNENDSTTRLNESLQDARNELSISAMYTDLCEHLHSHVKLNSESSQMIDIVCLGLGNFAESYIARYQLALLLALREHLQISAKVGTCEVYDPQFSKNEVDFLNQLGLTVPEDNMEGKHQARKGVTTLFYLPHCGKALYNNVLWANWGGQLQHILILGNSFSAMTERTPRRILEKTANYVIKIQPYTSEYPLSMPSDLESIFNDTSLHRFLSCDTQELPEALWEDNPEPVYESDDAEIILSANKECESCNLVT